MTEYASSNDIRIEVWDPKEKQLVTLNENERKDLTTKNVGWESPLGLVFEISHFNQVLIRKSDKGVADNVIVAVTWSNDKVDTLSVGEDMLEEGSDKPCKIEVEKLAGVERANLVSISAYEKNDNKPEKEKIYLWFNFPAPAPKRDLRIN